VNIRMDGEHVIEQHDLPKSFLKVSVKDQSMDAQLSLLSHIFHSTIRQLQRPQQELLLSTDKKTGEV
jgi:hypothetical protein